MNSWMSLIKKHSIFLFRIVSTIIKSYWKKNAILEYTSLYKMFEKELKIVKKYLENNLKKEFIIANRSSFISSIMFMKKTNESLRFCVDYKKLNQLIKKKQIFIITHWRNFDAFEKDKIFHQVKHSTSISSHSNNRRWIRRSHDVQNQIRRI
jgi:hypothetical protein